MDSMGEIYFGKRKKFLFGRKVVRLKPDQPDRRLRPWYCVCYFVGFHFDLIALLFKSFSRTSSLFHQPDRCGRARLPLNARGRAISRCSGRSKGRTCQPASGQDAVIGSTLPCLPRQLSVNKRKVLLRYMGADVSAERRRRTSVDNAALRYHRQVPAAVARWNHCQASTYDYTARKTPVRQVTTAWNQHRSDRQMTLDSEAPTHLARSRKRSCGTLSVT